MFFQILINGIAIGCIYGLVALCFVIIHKATDVLNFAQGELLMLSAYFIYGLTLAGVSLPLAIILSMVFSIMINFIIARGIMRPLIGYPLFPLVLATLAIGIIIKGVVLLSWGHDLLPLKSIFGNQIFRFKYFSISSMNLGTIGVTILLIILLSLFFASTKVGIALRATSEDVISSYLCGIPIKRVFWLSWVISGGIIGTIAGVLVAPITFLNPHMGYIGLLAFPAAVLGGFESIPGALIGGILLGVFELLAAGYLPEAIKSIFPWVALYVILLIRPEGIFGKFEKVRKV